jgi:hypothetical protein
MKGPVFSISAYFKDVLAKKLAKRVITPPTTTQQPSTLAILARDPSKDEEHFNRAWVDPMVYGLDGKVFINERSVTAMEVITAETARRRPKNTIGQAHLSGSTPLERTAAIKAFFEAGSVELSEADLETIMQYYADEPTKDVISAFDAIMERAGVLVKV